MIGLLVYRLWFTVDGVKIKEGREKSLPSFCLKSNDFYTLLFCFLKYFEGDGVVAGGGFADALGDGGEGFLWEF